MYLMRTPTNGLQNRRRNVPSTLFDDLFDDFFGPALSPARLASGQSHAMLQVDMYEKDNAVIIEAEMPGMAKDDICIDVHGRLVTLSGERKREEEVKDEHSFRRERSYGRFERTFSLPFEVHADKVNASLSNGVLKLEIEKPEEQQRKLIPIN